MADPSIPIATQRGHLAQRTGRDVPVQKGEGAPWTTTLNDHFVGETTLYGHFVGESTLYDHFVGETTVYAHFIGETTLYDPFQGLL